LVDWSTHASVILVLKDAEGFRPAGAAGAETPVVALAVLEYAESPPVFEARTRYE
jgi:hypothetical protein